MRRIRTPFAFRIGTRILLLNVLLVFVPVAVLLLLDTYELQLRTMLERSLVQQGRTLAAALSVQQALTAEHATAVLTALEGRHESRIRVVDTDGRLLADTSTIGPPAAPAADSARSPGDDPRESTLYRFASAPVRWFRSVAGGPEPQLPSADFYSTGQYAEGSEIAAALRGSYGAATRVSTGGQISVTLYSAIPIQREGSVTGAVLVSQSTYRILQDLYRVRLDVFLVFLLSLAVAVVLSLFLSLTIARPLARLQNQAQRAVDQHGRLTTPIGAMRRRDEVGALSRALAALTEQVEAHTRGLESFAADVAHELKNPLASIRVSCELAATASDAAVRTRFLEQAQADVQRCQRIIDALRELSNIDAGRDPATATAVHTPVLDAVAWCRSAHPNCQIVADIGPDAERVRVGLGAERVRQIVENLLDNAASFSEPGTPVRVAVRLQRGGEQPEVAIDISDRGIGLPEGDEEKVFGRFYSNRTNRDGHLGLGLAIVRSLVEQAEGTVTARNLPGGGARFSVLLPALPS